MIRNKHSSPAVNTVGLFDVKTIKDELMLREVV